MNSPTPNSPELADLAKTYPAPAARDLGADRHDFLRERFMTEIQTTHAERRPVRRYLVPVAATAVTAAVVAGVLIGHQGADQQAAAGQQSHGAAVRLLADVATAAGHQGNPVVRDDQYEYVKSVSSVPKGTSESWVPVTDLCRDGLMSRDGHRMPVAGVGKGDVQEGTAVPGKPGVLSGSTPVSVSCPDIGSVNEPSYRFLAALPTDPHTLLARIYHDTKGAGPSPDIEAFVTIGDLLRESVAPPAVTAALYRAAALIPGVTVGQDTVDAIGRHGVTVSMDEVGQRTEWIFDPASGQMLGEREVLTQDAREGKAGAVIENVAVVTRTFVDKLGSTR